MSTFKALSHAMDLLVLAHSKKVKSIDMKIKKLTDEKQELESENWKELNELRKMIRPVCPHEKETFSDNYHPHNGGSPDTMTCNLCGHSRKV